MQEKNPLKLKISFDTFRLITSPGLENLKNFDAERILSREYFRTLKLPQGKDSEILNSLPFHKFQDMERTLDRLQEISDSVASYEECLQEKFNNVQSELNEKTAEYFDLQTTDEEHKDTAKQDFLKRKILQLKAQKKLIEDFQTAARNLTADITSRIESIDSKIENHCRKIFSERLTKIRLATGKTQTEIAAFLGLSQTAYASYEIGRREPKFSTLSKICRMFKVSADWLLGIKN